jgi:hypothetical protein
LLNPLLRRKQIHKLHFDLVLEPLLAGTAKSLGVYPQRSFTVMPIRRLRVLKRMGEVTSKEDHTSPKIRQSIFVVRILRMTKRRNEMILTK